MSLFSIVKLGDVGCKEVIFKVMALQSKKIMSVKTTRCSQPYKSIIIMEKNKSELMIFLKFPGKMTSCPLNYLGNISAFWAHWRVKIITSFSWFLWKLKQSAVFLRMLLLPFKMIIWKNPLLGTYSDYSHFFDIIMCR